MSPIKSAMRPSSALLRYLRAMNTTVAAAPLCNTSGSTSERLSLLQRQKRRCASNRAYIALGSNIGDRIGAIETACRELDQNGLRVLRTSSLYETAPMYVEDQDSFLNAVCETEVDEGLSPQDLLRKVKAIENQMGRQKTIDKGPRNIDLDILLHNDSNFDSESLSIPHKSMLEREFVLRPLCDLIPNSTHPSTPGVSYEAHLSNLPASSTPISPLTPLSLTSPPLLSTHPTRSTKIMSIINLTPDSFSDGSLHSHSPTKLHPTLLSHLAQGATILDIGGQSTAPHAIQNSTSEELSRVLPTIAHISNSPELSKAIISIDTYRSSIAHAAVKAGAQIINDISGGLLDPTMLPTAASLNVSIILTHSRGDPNSMNKLAIYPNGIIPSVAEELLLRVRAAEEAGIRRWRILLDPGIGFAKTGDQNSEILRRFGELRDWPGLKGLPWVVGVSRKRFIGKVTGVEEPKERVIGSVVAMAAAVRGGADVVRVHDVRESVEGAKMADAIWRVK